MIHKFTVAPALLGITALGLIGCGAAEEEGKAFQAVHQEDGSVMECTGASADSCKWVSGPKAEAEAAFQAQVTAGDTGVAGMTLTKSSESMEVSENGTSSTFTVVLTSRPTDNVRLMLSNSDSDNSEITVSTGFSNDLTFDQWDWNVPRTVTVTGLDDCEGDGSVASNITVSVDKNLTLDTRYNDISDQTISVTTTEMSSWDTQLIHSSEGVNIATDSEGNIYVIGIIDGWNEEEEKEFANGRCNIEIGGKYGKNMILIKYDNNGNKQWIHTLAELVSYGDSHDYENGLTIDSDNNIFVTGANSSKRFIAKYSPSGVEEWKIENEKWGVSTGRDLTIDFEGNVYLVGTDGVAEWGNFIVEKYDSSGNLIWDKQIWETGGTLGSAYRSRGTSIATDSVGNIYALGTTNGNINLDGTGWENIMVQRNIDFSTGITTYCWQDDDGEETCSTTKPGTELAFKSGIDDDGEVFLIKYDRDGNYQWVKGIDSTAIQVGDIAIDSSDQIFVTAQSKSEKIMMKFDSKGFQYNLAKESLCKGLNQEKILIDNEGDIYSVSASYCFADPEKPTLKKYNSSWELIGEEEIVYEGFSFLIPNTFENTNFSLGPDGNFYVAGESNDENRHSQLTVYKHITELNPSVGLDPAPIVSVENNSIIEVDLNGTWTDLCQFDFWSTQYSQNTYTFNGNTFSSETKTYSDDSCTERSSGSDFRSNGTFSLENEGVVDGKQLTKINWNMTIAYAEGNNAFFFTEGQTYNLASAWYIDGEKMYATDGFSTTNSDFGDYEEATQIIYEYYFTRQ